MRKSLRWRQRTKLRVPALEVARVWWVVDEMRDFYHQPMNYEECKDLILGSRDNGGDRENFNALMHLYYHVIWKWLPKPLQDQIEYGEAFNRFSNETRNDFFSFHKVLPEGRVALKPDEYVFISLDEVMFLNRSLVQQRQLTLLYVERCDTVRKWFSGLVSDETNLACDEFLPAWLAQIE